MAKAKTTSSKTTTKATSKDTKPKVEEVKKVRNPKRSREELLSIVEEKIAHHKECIAKLEKKREYYLQAKPSIQMRTVLKKAQEKGMSTEEIIEKLGLNL